MEEISEVKRQAEQSPNASVEHDTPKDKYMTFKCGSEYYGLEIQYVDEIIPFQSITVIPETEDYIKGLLNLRGKIIPVIDVRTRFKQAPYEYDDRTCIVVITVKSTVVGLIVEKIAEVVEIHKENILPPPTIGRTDKAQNKYVYGIGKTGDTVKLLLDPDKLLNDNDISAMEQANETILDEE